MEMKHFYLSLVFVLLSLVGHAQNFKPTSAICPNVVQEYEFTAPHADATHFAFTVTGGVLPDYGNETSTNVIESRKIKIKWLPGTTNGRVTVHQYKWYDKHYTAVTANSQFVRNNLGDLGVVVYGSTIAGTAPAPAPMGYTTVTLTATSGDIPISNWQWGPLPAGMSYQGGVVPTGRIATVVLTGCESGTVSLNAITTCGTLTNTVNFNITRSGGIAQPIITETQPACPKDIELAVSNPGNGFTYHWEAISDNLRFAGGATTATGSMVSVTGLGFIRVTTSGCGATPHSFIYNAGFRYQPGHIVLEYDSHQSVKASLPAEAGATAYRWYIKGVLETTTTLPNAVLYFNTCGERVTFGVEVVYGNCGVISGRAEGEYQTPSCPDDGETCPLPPCNPGGGGGVTWSYPNPVNNALTVEVVKVEGKGKKVVEVKLYDSQGNLKKSVTVNGKAVINTSKLPAGIYYLHSSDGTTTEKKQIIIER